MRPASTLGQHSAMRAPALLLALAALFCAARGAPDAPAEAPAPLRQLDVAELTAMQARLAALAQDVQRALATAPGGPAPAEAPTPKSKLEYLHDSLMARQSTRKQRLCAVTDDSRRADVAGRAARPARRDAGAWRRRRHVTRRDARLHDGPCKPAALAQVGPSVQLRWRTLRRAVWALLRRAVLAAVDYIGALTLLAVATGKLFAIQLACVQRHRK